MAYKDTGTMPDGLAAAPGLAFDSEPTMGFFRKAAGKIGLAVGGLEVGVVDASGFQGGLHAVERTFTETTGAGTYTATVPIPAGTWLLDVLWVNTALWTAATSATMQAGDDDTADGFFTAVNAKSAPAAGLAISFNDGDSGVGSYSAAAGPGKYYSAAKTLTATVVTVGSTGSAGRSRLVALYVVPPTAAATKA